MEAGMTERESNVVTRRRVIAGSALVLGGLAVAGPAAAQEKPAMPSEVVRVNAIHQEEDFAASPQRIYEALLDAKQFTAFSGGRVAEINREVGGAFSIFSGHIIGRNLELVANRRIVQAWRVVPWAKGVYSIARFELNTHGPGTRVILDHTGFPTKLAEHLASGWHENYWTLLRKYLS
jgi:activator of HSP90 ATPase